MLRSEIEMAAMLRLLTLQILPRQSRTGRGAQGDENFILSCGQLNDTIART
jgi:hypothetical protein